MKIFKYKLDGGIVNAPQTISMPSGARVLSVGIQVDPPLDPIFVVWAEVDPEAQIIEHGFYIAFTGYPAPPSGWRFIDTLQVRGFVLHIYGTA